MTRAQKLAWLAFGAGLLCASAFFAVSSQMLPRLVAVHFDEAGGATSFMPKSRYGWLIGIMGIAVPLFAVVVLNAVYSKSRNLRLPHSAYWMASPRIGATRAFLKAHATWFGLMLVLLMSFMHWLILSANVLQPPQLANQTLLIGSFIVLISMSAWIGVLMFKFRRPT